MNDRLNVFLDSRERNNAANDPSDATYYFTDPLPAGRYLIRSFLLANTFYNVDSTNNIIYFNENSTNKTATITAGYYTSSTFPAAVKTAMDTASGGYNTFTVTLDSATKKVTIAAGNAFSFKFATNLNTGLGAQDLIGVGPLDTSAVTSYTCTRVMNLADPMAVLVQIDPVSDNIRSMYGSASGCIYIPIVKPWGDIVEINDTTEYPQSITLPNQTSKLKVTFRDSKGRVRSLVGGRYYIWLERAHC